MLDHLLQFKFTSLLGLLLYWLPLAICLVGFTARTARNYVKDRKAREEPGRLYLPTDTIGSLIGRAVVSAIPIANIWAAAFDVAPKWLSRFYTWLGATFDQPLVPDNEPAKAARHGLTPRKED